MISSADLRAESDVAGNVKRGTWIRAKVAIKQLPVSGEQAIALIAKQVSQRTKLSHPHVLPLYGACLESTPPLLVYEDAENGTIAQYFRNGVNHDAFWTLFHQTSTGLQFLEANKMTHGNLKCSNILVGADDTAKISDFGFEFNRKATSRGLRSDSSMDIFSLGICIIQAWSGKDSAEEETVSDAKIPQRPAGMSDQGWWLVERMCDVDPLRRPTLAEVSNKLHELVVTEEVVRASHGDRICRVCSAIGTSADKFCASCGTDVRVPVTSEQSAAPQKHEGLNGAPPIQHAVNRPLRFVLDQAESSPLNVIPRAHERQAFGYSGVYAH